MAVVEDLEIHMKTVDLRMSAGRPDAGVESAEIEGVRCMMCVTFRWVDKKMEGLSQNNLLDCFHAENIQSRCFHLAAAINEISSYSRTKTASTYLTMMTSKHSCDAPHHTSCTALMLRLLRAGVISRLLRTARLLSTAPK